jgi:hypothetical protein
VARGDFSVTRTTSRFTRPDGRVVHVLATSTVEPDPDGGEALLVTHFQDITEQVMALANLRVLVENTPVALHLVDRNGRVLFTVGTEPAAAQARMNDARTASLEEVFADFPEGTDLLHRALRGERISQALEAYGRFYDIRMAPVPGPDNEVSVIAIVASDVTQREVALMELRARSAEQAIVADLGRRGLATLDPGPLLTRAARALAGQLDAMAVTVHECDPSDSGGRGPAAPTAPAAGLVAAVGDPPGSSALPSRALSSRGPARARSPGAGTAADTRSADTRSADTGAWCGWPFRWVLPIVPRR